MGNIFATKLDFVLELPPELVSVVLSYLTLPEVLNCLLVCKKWRETILHLVPYWTNLLHGLGVPLRTVSCDLGAFSSLKDLYFRVRSHLRVAKSLEWACSVPVCYPHYQWQGQCLHFGSKHGVMIRTGTAKGANNSLVVDSIVGGGEVVYAKRLGYVALAGGVPLKWGHYSSSGCVYWADRSGLCRGYDVESGKELCALSHREGKTLASRPTVGCGAVRARCERNEEEKVVVECRKAKETAQPCKKVKESSKLCKSKEMAAQLCEHEEAEASRLWEREKASSNETVQSCEGEAVSVQQPCEEKEASSRVRDVGEELLAGCEECSMVIWCKLESSEYNAAAFSDVRLQVARLDVSPVDVSTVQVTHRHTPACIAARARTGSTGGLKGTADVRTCQTSGCQDTNGLAGSTGLRLSGSGDHSVETGGMCRHHYIFLQDYFPATIVIGMKLVRNSAGPPAMPSTPAAPWHLKTWHKCISCSHKIPVRLGGIKQCVCGDRFLMGHISNKTMYVWEASEELKKLQLVSKAEIAAQTHCRSVLVALGKDLSIVVQKSKEELCIPPCSEMVIIQTGSGSVLHRISTSIPPSPSCCWYLVSRETWRWLSDVRAPSPPILLTVMYSDDVTGRLAFALVRQPNRKHRQQPPHWVQAVNHTFQKNL